MTLRWSLISSQGGGGSHNIETEDEDDYNCKDKYNYQDNIKIDDLWCELQCDNVFYSGLRPLHNHTMWIYLWISYERTVGAKHYNLSSSHSSLWGDNRFAVPYRTVHLEGKVQGVVADKPIRAGQWIWKSHNTARLLDEHSYQKFLWYGPVYLACDINQWIRKGYGTMILGGSPDIHGFRQWILL